jgi:hypothetical protein
MPQPNGSEAEPTGNMAVLAARAGVPMVWFFRHAELPQASGSTGAATTATSVICSASGEQNASENMVL